jgi:protocatechuate 3,4-dioxygenase beta subunit
VFKKLMFLSFIAVIMTLNACSTAPVRKLDDGRSVYKTEDGSGIRREAVINGHVYDNKTGRPVKGASVEIKNANMGVGYYMVRTDGGGSFTVRDFIPHIQYVIEVAAEGYVTYTYTDRISAGSFDIRLEPEGILAGSVQDSEGSPLSGVELKLTESRYRDPGPARVKVYTTGADGSYRFNKLPEGGYAIAFAKSGYISETGRIKRVKAGETFRLPMKLFRPASVSGIITIKELGVPAQGIDVIAKGRSNHSVSSYHDGTFRMEDMKPGNYELHIRHQGFYSVDKRSITLKEGEDKKGVDYVVEPKKPEIQVYAYRYTFAPGNDLTFDLRTFRLETVTATVYSVPMSTFLRGRTEPDDVSPDREKFKKMARWKEPISNFEPYQWRYQQLSIKDPLQPGGYCLEVEGADSVVTRRYFTVTSVGVVVKRSEEKVFSYVTSLVSNEPLADASVVVFENLPEVKNRQTYYRSPERIEDLPVKIMARGKTGADGVVENALKLRISVRACPSSDGVTPSAIPGRLKGSSARRTST